MTTEKQSDVVNYTFTFTFSASGVVTSNLGLQEARDQFNRELGTYYSPDAVEITEFRVATPEEVAEYEQAVQAAMGPDVDPTKLN